MVSKRFALNVWELGHHQKDGFAPADYWKLDFEICSFHHLVMVIPP